MTTHTIRLDLPWSCPPLSMNDSGASRGAMFAKAAKRREIRETVAIIGRAEGVPTNVAHVTVQLHYRPRDNRARDTDNLTATLKPICDALTPSRMVGRKYYPGCAMVIDDTPRFMAKNEPIIHPAERGAGGAMWLVLTWKPRDPSPHTDQAPKIAPAAHAGAGIEVPE